jgi:phospho-N-acetylmuramoyl-pentapeptide-transferase
MSGLEIFSYLLLSVVLSLALAIPVISLLYRFNVTRRGEADFSNLIEKRKLKIGVPIMGGLIMVLTILAINMLFNRSAAVLVVMAMFVISALLGGMDDLLNIFGYKRRVRALDKIRTLIRVHASKLVRLKLIVMYPWFVYSRFFFMLGSNPGKGIHAHEKILVQSVAGAMLGVWLASTNALGTVHIPFIASIDLGWLFIPFVILSVVLMTNAVNIADGLDGLSTNEMLASFLGFLIIAIDKQAWDITILICTVIGALLGYLYFNIPPARVQMGDVGSLSLGALLAACAFILEVPLLLLIISLPFVITLLSTVVQGFARRILGRRILRMAPIHHHFEMLGWSEEKVVMRFALFSLLCMIIGVWVYFADKLMP